jgi:lysophospholipase L1-like esterase
MPTVVLFGDSNTWGYVPGTESGRYPRDVRWAGRLAAALDGWEVVAEGLNGRTATVDSPSSEGRNGLTYLIPCLQSHAPVDALVIYLGTNDVGEPYRLDAETAAASVGRLVRWARFAEAGPGGSPPEILVVCPPPFEGHVLGPAFETMCDELDCELLDLDGVAVYSELDGIHLDADGHAAVAAAVEERLRDLLA